MLEKLFWVHVWFAGLMSISQIAAFPLGRFRTTDLFAFSKAPDPTFTFQASEGSVSSADSSPLHLQTSPAFC